MLNNNKKILTLKIVACILLVLVVLSVFHYQSPDIANNIDGSWVYSLSTLRHSGQALGTDLFYTYGPLYSKLPTFPLFNDTLGSFIVGVLFTTMLAALVIYVYLRLLHFIEVTRDKVQIALYGLGFVLFLSIIPFSADSLFYILLLATLVLVRKETNTARKLLVLLPLALFSLYKVSFSIAFVALIPLSILPTRFKFKYFKKPALIYSATISWTFLCFALLSRGNLLGFINYMKIGVLNSSSYPEFMTLTYSTNKYIVLAYALILTLSILSSLALVLLLKTGRLNKKRPAYLEILFFLAIIYLTAGLNYKQAVVRSDGHLVAFIPMLPIMLLPINYLFFWLVKPTRKYTEKLSLLFSLFLGILALAVIMKQVSPGLSLRSYATTKLDASRISLARNPLSYGSFRDRASFTKHEMTTQYMSTKELRDYLTNENLTRKDVIFFGNTTSLADTLKNRTLYLPFLQNYAAFPPQLFDPLYIKMLEQNRNALIFVDEKEPSINERIPLHELNNFSMYLSQNYRLIYKDPQRRQYLLERVSNKHEKCTFLKSFDIYKSKKFELPLYDTHSNEYIKLRVNFNADIREAALSTLMKPLVYTLDLYPNTGGRDPRRTTKSTLEHGITIDPFFIRYTDIANGDELKLNGIGISGGLDTAPRKGTYELCSF